MSKHWGLSEADPRVDFYRQKPVADPAEVAKEHGVSHKTSALRTGLTPLTPMPVGHYTGRLMRDVPADYLAWVNAQPWAAHWRAWDPVRDFLAVYPVLEWRGPWPLICLSRQRPQPNPWNLPAVSQLTCHPEHEDKLHAFAKAVLNLLPHHYQHPHRFDPPFYLLTPRSHELALKGGATYLEEHEQERQHLARWKRHLTTCTKHCYGSEEEAMATARHRQTSMFGRPEKPLRAYLCPICDFYHLTKKPLQ